MKSYITLLSIQSRISKAQFFFFFAVFACFCLTLPFTVQRTCISKRFVCLFLTSLLHCSWFPKSPYYFIRIVHKLSLCTYIFSWLYVSSIVEKLSNHSVCADCYRNSKNPKFTAGTCGTYQTHLEYTHSLCIVGKVLGILE